MKLAHIAIVLALGAALALTQAEAKDWAVLVAGSNGFWNYRHQADIAHAYQILRKGGLSDDQIIVMFYDDVANSASNPFRGKLYNKPTAAGVKGVDVYAGLKKDYVGKDVTAANFMAVMTGNRTAANGKKVLESTSEDNVFVFYSDHGSVGSIAMPVGPALTVSQLQNTLKTMYNKKSYNKLVFYLEACESGSMFAGALPGNMNIWATTAANPSESSWGTYCSPNDKVEGRSIGSCLGDEYSVSWMEDTEANGFRQSLQTQFESVRTLVKKSHVMLYGDQSLKNDPIGNYMGGRTRHLIGRSRPSRKGETQNLDVGRQDSRDIKLHYMFNKYIKRDDTRTLEQMLDDGNELMDEIKHRMNEDIRYYQLAASLVGEKDAKYLMTMPTRPPIECGRCCDAAFETVYNECGGFSDYSFKYARTITNLCMMSSKDMTATVVDRLTQICKNPSTVN